MHTTHSNPYNPQFGGLAPVMSANLLARGLAGIEKAHHRMEARGGNAYANLKFAEDMASSMGSRLLVSSSQVEKLEITVSEIIENLLVYYGLAALANRVFKPMMARQAKVNPSGMGVNTLLEKMTPTQLAKHLPARLGTYMAAFGLTLFGGEFAMLFAKNIGTANLFGKGSFSQVLNLNRNKNKEAVDGTLQQSRKGFVVSLGLALASVVAGVGVARFGGGALKGASEATLNRLKRGSRFFDFSIEQKAGKFFYGFTKHHLRLYMAISGIGYLLAARDKLERQEILPRFGLIFAYLGFLSDGFKERLLYPLALKRFPELISRKTMDADGHVLRKPILTLKAITSDGLKQALEGLPKARQAKLTRVYIALATLPFIIGTGVVSLANGALNRYFTYQRYDRDRRQQATHTMSRLNPLLPAAQQLKTATRLA